MTRRPDGIGTPRSNAEASRTVAEGDVRELPAAACEAPASIASQHVELDTRDEYSVQPRHGVPDPLKPLDSAFSGRSHLDPARLPASIRALLAAPSDELRSTLDDWVHRLAS